MLTQEWIEGLPELMGEAVEASPGLGYLVGQGRLDLVPTALAGDPG